MDGSDLATVVWHFLDLPSSGANDSLHMQTLSSTNVLGTVQTIDSDILTNGATSVDEIYKNRIGLGVIDSTDQIYIPYYDNGSISVADWASGASPSFTITTSVNDQAVSTAAARDEFPQSGMGLTVDGANNISLIYSDDTYDVWRDADVDGGGTTDTELLNNRTIRYVSPIWDTDDSDDLYIYEEEGAGRLIPLTNQTAGTDNNVHTLGIAQGSTDMSDGVLLDARNLILVWGLREHALSVKFGSNGYFTERHVENQEGVWIADRGAGDVAYMTSDGGVQFAPPVEISVTFTGLRDNTEIRICDASTGLELAGIENATTGSPDNRSWTVALTAGTLVDIRFAHGTAADGNVYTVPDRNSILDFTWPASTTILPITQVLDRTFFDPP